MKEIFIIDDNISTCDQIRDYLDNSGYSVIDAVSSFKKSPEKIKSAQPDLILLNRHNNTNFIDPLKFISQKFDIPIIFIDAEKNNYDNYPLKSTDHIHPPLEKDELLHVLERNLRVKKNNTQPIHNGISKQAYEIISEYGEDVYHFIEEYIDLYDRKNKIVPASSNFSFKPNNTEEYASVANFNRIENILYLNDFFKEINRILPVDGIYIGCADIRLSDKKRIFSRLVKKDKKVLSKPEILGRLYSCGFEIMDELHSGNHYFFAVKKSKEPTTENYTAYGPLLRMKRIGKEGKFIKVYKFRTMLPYSEYLQDYIYKKNKLAEGGKFNDDFRITPSGRIMRKLFIDEIPMLFNLIKGDLKFFGVRPLSEHYFSLYPEDFRNVRIKYKPGLIPPYYKDLPKTLEEIIESEKKYLSSFDKHPFKTDLHYFLHATYNILVKRVWSK